MSQSYTTSDKDSVMPNNIIDADSPQTPKKLMININTRVDHMMRFSKQAVLVVDEDKEIYSQVGTNFLAASPDNNNAAFISLSDKLDDIQIRCRLVEQLFSDTLFDPEESLAVTLLKLAEDKSEVISIVVENVQLLSLQLMHEFCQVAELAIKTDRTINVLLTGTEVTGKLLAKNKDIFTNKISVLSAQTGQLLALDTPSFNEPSSIFSFARWKLNSLIFAIISMAIFGLLFTMYQVDSFSFSGLSKVLSEQTTNENIPPVSDIFVEPVVLEGERLIAKPADILLAINSFTPAAAAADVIPTRYASVTTNKSKTYRQDETVISLASDESSIIKVTPLSKPELEPEQHKETLQPQALLGPESELQSDKSNSYESYQAVDDYYLNLTGGYVIQIKGFLNIEQYNEFHQKYADMNLPSFHRMFNQKEYIFVTSTMLESHDAATRALADLAPEFKDSGAWVKSVAAIQHEIKQYQATKK